jgi:PPK2 family polyphosphate:nucleotide phosphotransferase
MDRYRVRPGTTVALKHMDPQDHTAFDGNKIEAEQELAQLEDRLAVLQDLLWADASHAVLVVLQALDGGGKDGTVRHVFRGLNPQSVKVSAFKSPSTEELSHDYLWRVHARAPVRGELTIFNRSHYEDVLVVRVHDMVPVEVWQRRFGHINCFERMLTDEGTTIVKFFLHISKDEQKRRLDARLAEPDKRWKFSQQDLAERERWSEYIEAYEDVLSQTSTSYAPWYVVPADTKWYRNLVVSRVLVKTLEELHMHYPEAAPGVVALAAEAGDGAAGA